MKYDRSVNFSQSAGVKPLPFWNGETARSGYDWLAIFGWTDHRNVTQLVRVYRLRRRFCNVGSNPTVPKPWYLPTLNQRGLQLS